ncbi:hypothetical protein QT06_C0001G0630 [archaeon GW2011_AR15]|nr:hypothetical protein QT06_C0001G0630 [archaeon GW2011_AR15]MBS3103582.1 HAD-IIIA family hydrolase [Candidatus Woesearchaeota archaeon]
MSNSAVFLDRDGTLTRDIGFSHRVEDFALLPGVIEGLEKLKTYKLFIVTNQSGIARGIFSKEDMESYNNKLLHVLSAHNINIERVYFCPHAPEDNCACRKPKPKMIRDARDKYQLDLVSSWVIGDKASDIVLGINSGMKSVFLLTGLGPSQLAVAREKNPSYIAGNLSRAADFLKFSDYDKIVDSKKLVEISIKLKSTGKRIVTLNGTFDILHEGHDYIVSEAKKQGDVLIIAVNSDSSVRQNKGNDRPLNNELSRQKMMANYMEVDYVTVFNETTPVRLLEKIRPDVHVNGSEYGKDCVEASTIKKHGGSIHIVKLLPGLSSTRIIKGELNQ